MRFKRLLALLLAAALALAVLVGCGSGQQSVASALLKLLDGRYPNISIEIDPDLEADLRQAVNEGETDAEIRAALEKLLGSGVSFRLIGDGQKGDSAWNLILYPGSDPDAAARSAYLEWDKIFSAFPSSGLYTAKLSMIETDNGYAILVKATVDKAASRNDDDDDEPEEPEEEIPASGYKKTSDTSYKVYNDIGLTSVLFDGSELATDRNSGFAGVTIELAADSYSVDDTFTTPFKGILKSANGSRATINLKEGSRGLFEQIDTNGKVENITFDVQANITDTYTHVDEAGQYIYAGAVAGQNNGTVTNCTVTGGKIQATSDDAYAYAGGLVGENRGTIDGSCRVEHTSVSATANATAYAGGLVGENRGTIAGSSCRVENTSVSATANIGILHAQAYAGGLVGHNGSGTVDGTYSGTGDISATATTYAHAGGLVGNNSGSVGGTYSGRSTITATGTMKSATANAGGLVGWNTGSVDATYTGSGSITATGMNEFVTAYAGGLVGYNDGTVTGNWTPTNSDAFKTITARTWLNGSSYNNFASVPKADGSNTDQKPDSNITSAYAGTGIGGPTPVPHTDLSLNPSTDGTTTTP